MTTGSRLPQLGPRGEGWVAGQAVLFVAIAGFGLADLSSTRGEDGTPARLVIGAVAVIAGASLAVRGAWDLGTSLSPFPRPIAGAPLIDSGAFRLVRHPIYAGLVLAAIGWALTTGSVGALISAGLLFALFDAKSRREEVWLAEEHRDYAAYRLRTKRLIPWVY